MSQKLQMDVELTLEVKKAIHQAEAVHEQQQQLQGDSSAKDPIVVDGVEVKIPRAVLATNHLKRWKVPAYTEAVNRVCDMVKPDIWLLTSAKQECHLSQM